MNFILVFNSNDEVLLDNISSVDAVTYKAKSFHRGAFEKLEYITYEYDTWLLGEGVEVVSQQFSLLKGMAIKSQSVNELIGDYIKMDIDITGNGKIHRPCISFHQLYFYESNGCQVIASDLALIIKAVKKYSDNTLLTNFDHDFIRESIDNEWKGRVLLDSTFLQGITRIQPYDNINIKNFNIELLKVKNISDVPIDNNLELLYLDSKEDFYQVLMGRIDNAVSQIIETSGLSKVELRLSGGLDSRAALSVLSKQIDLDVNAMTAGPDDHPDVEIAKELSERLNINHTILNDVNSSADVPASIDDYVNCFKTSLGNWNSNNFRVDNKFSSDVSLYGADNFKRMSLAVITSGNRWFASRVSNTDILPIISLYEVNQISLLGAKYKDAGIPQDFIYYLIEYFSPEINDIPFVGQTLRKSNVAAYRTITESKIMPSHLSQGYFDIDKVIEVLPYLRPVFTNKSLLIMQKMAFKISKALNNIIVNKIFKHLGLSEVELERKRRIAMDFASVAHLKGSDL
jgi:hypothetical protein